MHTIWGLQFLPLSHKILSHLDTCGVLYTLIRQLRSISRWDDGTVGPFHACVWQARKIRVKIERDIAGKEDDCDPESNTDTHDKQTHSFPTPEERKNYYREAYEVTR